ncbi:MAG: UDP-N-acetylmuramoyl-L-alanine--D-glutamate ligase [Polaromonas sp.]|nr:UDP-N-acetylmuramoyl-L-alanine--D-glutamate ligase [Polaromonas sp.]
MKKLANQHVLVLGLGLSGLALARWCARRGSLVTVADTRVAPPQLATLQKEWPAVTFIAGDFSALMGRGEHFDLVLRSPGLSPAEIAPVLQAAKEQGVAVGNELTLFAEALRALAEVETEAPTAETEDDSESPAELPVEPAPKRAYQPKVIAITGTNGKTTVTSLTGQLLQRAGKRVAVAGNIGPTLLDTLQTCIDTDALPDVWVLELSSFQLDEVTGFEPSVATVLNISQDHLDWHGSMDAYVRAKSAIYGHSGVMLLNRDDPLVMAVVPALVKGKQLRDVLTFGGDVPRRPGDYGIETVNGMAWLVRAAEADETIKRRRDEEIPIYVQRLMPVDALHIRGRHNATNALAALGLANAIGCTMAPLLHGLRDYRGEPHRLESVAVVNDVEYFDDSKGTNVGATVAALNGLGPDRRLVLILGGEGKGQDFNPLAEPVARYARAVVLIGRDAPLIQAALECTGVDMLAADSMADAVDLAASVAQAGDAVLMSPACASFDMFDNYGHRAQMFCDAVQALALDAGAVI